MIIKKREYSDEEIKLITQQPYISSITLSEQLKIPASSIRRFRNANKIKTRGKLSYVSQEDFIEKYKELKSQQKIANYYNVDHHVINNYAKKIGFDDSIYKKQKLNEEQIKYIIDNYETKTSTQIAKELNISSEAVSNVWFRNHLFGKDKRVYSLLNENYFEKIDSQDKAYFLGFIGADGCLYETKDKNKQNILRINIQKKDIKILQLLKEYLKTDKPIGSTTKNSREYVSLEISSNKIFSDIEKLRLHPRKTYENTIATIPKEFMPALIRGYFDGDGSITNNKKIIDSEISIAGYYSNMVKIQNYLNSRNIYSTIVYDNRKYNSKNNDRFCSLSLPNKTSKYCFIKLIYENSNNVYMDRKYERSMKYIELIESSENIRDKQIVNYYKYAVQKVS